jgi:hypothetical protein
MSNREQEEERFQVVAASKPDYSTQRVACVYCGLGSLMKWLPGMPQGHGQWLCERCGSMAYEGYGDTPLHNTDPHADMIISTNEPYPTGIDTVDMARPYVKEMPSDLDVELEQEFDEERAAGRPSITQIWSGNKNVKRRFGMAHDIQTAEEATRMI